MHDWLLLAKNDRNETKKVLQLAKIGLDFIAW